MSTLILSESALAVLRLRLSGRRVEVTDDNCDAYKVLAATGLAEPIHTPRGRDSQYRLTLLAMERKTELLNGPSPPPSP